MLSYNEYKALNESLMSAGPITLGLGQPTVLGGVIGGLGGTQAQLDVEIEELEALLEAKKKKMKKKMNGDDVDMDVDMDVEDDVEDVEDEDDAEGKIKIKIKNGDDEDEEELNGNGNGNGNGDLEMAKKKSKKKAKKKMKTEAVLDEILDLENMLDDLKQEILKNDPVALLEAKKKKWLRKSSKVCPECNEKKCVCAKNMCGDKHMACESELEEIQDVLTEMKHKMKKMGYMSYMKKDKGKMCPKCKKCPCKCMSHKMSHKMGYMKETDNEWAKSINNMLNSPLQPKYWDGFSQIEEDSLLPPTDPNAGLEDATPGPGEVGFAPETRFGAGS